MAGHTKKIVCAAVTIIMRIMAKLAYANPAIQIAGNKGKLGEMQLKVLYYDQKVQDWFKGITDFCVAGLEDLEQEYPKCILIKYSYE